MSSPTTIRLREFDMDMVRDGSVVVMIGKRNTGKSYLIKDLLARKTDIPAAVVISPTEQSNRFYSDMIPPLFIHDEYSSDIVDKLVTRQKKVTKESKRDPDIDPRCLMVMDDCLYDASSWSKDKRIREIFMNGRHFNITYCLSTQYVLGFPPQLRSQVDFVFLLRETMVRNKRLLFDNFAGMFNSFDVFNTVMNQVCQDYNCLVINMSSNSDRLEDQVYWYKAREHPPFTMCSRKMWDLSNAHLEADRSGSEEDEPFDPNAPRRNQRRVTVKKV